MTNETTQETSRGIIQNIQFKLCLKCKKCGETYNLKDYTKFITHKDNTTSIRFNDFHSTICKCEEIK